MNGLTEAFAESSIIWLLISTVVAVIAGLASSWTTYRFKRWKRIAATDKALGELRSLCEELLDLKRTT